MSPKFPQTIVKKIKGKGRGVLALSSIKKDTLIESCPVVLFPVKLGNNHMLEGYAFRWTKTHVALALGNGSLYNHSYKPNAEYFQDKKSGTLEVYALRNIKPGEEICFNYNGHPDNKSALWFKARN